MPKKILVLVCLMGFSLGVTICSLFSQPYVSNKLILMLPCGALLLFIFFLSKSRIELILVLMFLNIMIGSMGSFKMALLNINRLMGCMIVFLLFIDIFLLKCRKIQFSIQNLWLVIFAVIVFISAFFAVDFQVSIKGIRIFFRVFFLYFLIINVIDSELWLRRFVSVLLISGIILISFSLADNYSFRKYGIPLTDKLGVASTPKEYLEYMRKSRDPYRLYGIKGSTFHANSFALILVMLLPLSLAGLYEKKTYNKAFYLLCGGIIFIGLILTLSRGALIGLIISIIMVIRKSLVSKTSIIVSLIVLMLFCSPFISRISGKAFKRIYTFFKTVSNKPIDKREKQDIQNIINRINYYRAGIDMLLDHPILGVGIGNFPYEYVKYAPPGGRRVPSFSHNTFMQILLEIGIFGFAVFIMGIILIFNMLKQCRIIARERDNSYLLVLSHLFEISLVSFFIVGSFMSAAYTDIFWIILSLSTALYMIGNRRQISTCSLAA